MIDERLLQGMQFTAAGEPLDREHLFSRHVLERRETGAHRLAVEDYGAGAAVALPASVLGAGQRKMGAQRPQEHVLFVGVQTDSPAIEFKFDRPFRWNTHISDFKFGPILRILSLSAGNFDPQIYLSAAHEIACLNGRRER